jgi:L-amino acid N-acyltransferase YncA
VELSIYVSTEWSGRGVGKALYSALIRTLQAQQVRQLVAVIALPNDRSVDMHKKFGFVETGILCNIGFKLSRWIDVVYMQRPLNEDGAPMHEPLYLPQCHDQVEAIIRDSNSSRNDS